jgi:hypothetical protein
MKHPLHKGCLPGSSGSDAGDGPFLKNILQARGILKATQAVENPLSRKQDLPACRLVNLFVTAGKRNRSPELRPCAWWNGPRS